MQINRLFEIVYILLNKKQVTAKELALRFEVSQRTIYRDIEVLCQSGIPIYTNKGKGGGISLLDSFVLNKSILSAEEQTEILSALQSLNATSYPDVNRVMEKLTRLFNKDQVNWVQVDFSDWSGEGEEKFALIKAAILHKKVLRFDYYSTGGEMTHRSVEPLQLWFKDRTWYVKAFCQSRETMRTFKLTRMKRLEVTSVGFESALEDQMEKLKQDKKQKEVYITENNPEQEAVTLKLKIDHSQAYRIYDEFDEGQIAKQEEGSFLITVTYIEDEWVYGYLLSFGAFLEVLAPAHIRTIIKIRLEKTLQLYS